MPDDWSFHTTLENFGIIVTALGTIVQIVISILHEGKSSQNFPEPLERAGSPQKSSRRISWRWLSGGLAFLGLCVLFVALFIFPEKVPLVVVGSGNVESYLMDKVPEFRKLNPVMIDVGSGAGFDLLLKAAEFGNVSLTAKNAGVVVALSSAGDEDFVKTISDLDRAAGPDNEWLSVHIADPPLAFMYTTTSNIRKQVDQSTVDGFEYNFISCSNLLRFYKSPISPGEVRAISEPRTGTLENTLKGCNWKQFPTSASDENGAVSVTHPVHFLEEVPDNEVYSDLRSWAPAYRGDPAESTGKSTKKQPDQILTDLNQRHLNMAVVCSDIYKPESCAKAAFVVVVKVQKAGKGKYKIPTKSACELVEALSGKVHGCEFSTDDARKLNNNTNGYQLWRIESVESERNKTTLPAHFKFGG